MHYSKCISNEISIIILKIKKKKQLKLNLGQYKIKQPLIVLFFRNFEKYLIFPEKTEKCKKDEKEYFFFLVYGLEKLGNFAFVLVFLQNFRILFFKHLICRISRATYCRDLEL